MDIATLRAEDLEPLVGQSLAVRTSAGDLPLRLDEVAPHPERSAPEEATRPGFTLTLSGPRTPLLQHGVWEIVLPDLGEVALFLSPFAQTDAATRYEIVVN